MANKNAKQTQVNMNHHADQLNSNIGTKGTNKAYDDVQKNKEIQLSSNKPKNSNSNRK